MRLPFPCPLFSGWALAAALAAVAALYLSDAFGLWQRCDAQQYPVTPKLGKALFGNAVMPSSTQFIPELGKALSGNAVMPSSTQFIPDLGKALSRKCNKQTYQAILPRGLLRASPPFQRMPAVHASSACLRLMLLVNGSRACFRHVLSVHASSTCFLHRPPPHARPLHLSLVLAQAPVTCFQFDSNSTSPTHTSGPPDPVFWNLGVSQKGARRVVI